jgi:hypothetical protein
MTQFPKWYQNLATPQPIGHHGRGACVSPIFDISNEQLMRVVAFAFTGNWRLATAFETEQGK